MHPKTLLFLILVVVFFMLSKCSYTKDNKTQQTQEDRVDLVKDSLPSTVLALEEQANAIEHSKNNARNEIQKISDIFSEYKKSIQITTSQPRVSDSDGINVRLSMDVFVELKNPDLVSQIITLMNKYFIYHAKNYDAYIETSIAAGGNREAWDEFAKNGLIAEISFLGDKRQVPIFGTFEYWFNLKVTKKEKFNVIFLVDKKRIKNMDKISTPNIAIVTRVCQTRDEYYKMQYLCSH